MTKYLFRRLMQSALLLVLVVTAVFLIFQVMPGDITTMIIDPETPPEARIVAPPGSVLLYAAVDDPMRRQALETRGVEVAFLPSPAGKVDLAAMLADLARRGVNELHVEAGEKLNASLLAAGLVDELLVYVAPRLIGSGRGLAALAPIARLDDALRFAYTAVDRVGDDLRLRLRPAPTSRPT